jgi:hypothetical protein
MEKDSAPVHLTALIAREPLTSALLFDLAIFTCVTLQFSAG